MEDADFHFSVTPLHNVKPGDDDFESDMFEFEVEATFTHVPDQDDDDDHDSDVLHYTNNLITCTIRPVKFMVERRANDDSFRENVTCRLEGLGVPADMQPDLVCRILHEAKSTERDKGFLGCKVIRLSFSIDVVVDNLDETLNLDRDDEALNPDSDDDVIDAVMVPASKSSMERLERVNVEGSDTQCSICLEEISTRFEVIRLPCSHIYHGQCIRNWLEKNGVCPICRFVI